MHPNARTPRNLFSFKTTLNYFVLYANPPVMVLSRKSFH